MPKKVVKVHYRRVNRDNNALPNTPFHNLLSSALKKDIGNGKTVADSVAQRLAAVPNNEDDRRLINNFYIHDNYVFGNLVQFSPGQLQALLKKGDSSVDYSSEVCLDLVEDKAPEGMEYIRGVSYWLSIGDHFYIIQNVSLTSKAAEEYLTWLLRDKTRILDDSQYVALDALLDRAQVGGDLGDINSIEIGGLVPETVRALPSESIAQESGVEDVVTRQSLGERFAAFGKAFTIIKDLVGEVEAKKILEKIPDEAALEVKVSIGFRSTTRRLKKAFMKEIESGLRNLPDGEMRVRSKDGYVKGGDVRLSQDMPVELTKDGSSLLVLSDALNQMLEVHRRFVEDGRIKA